MNWPWWETSHYLRTATPASFAVRSRACTRQVQNRLRASRGLPYLRSRTYSMVTARSYHRARILSTASTLSLSNGALFTKHYIQSTHIFSRRIRLALVQSGTSRRRCSLGIPVRLTPSANLWMLKASLDPWTPLLRRSPVCLVGRSKMRAKL